MRVGLWKPASVSRRCSAPMSFGDSGTQRGSRSSTRARAPATWRGAALTARRRSATERVRAGAGVGDERSRTALAIDPATSATAAKTAMSVTVRVNVDHGVASILER